MTDANKSGAAESVTHLEHIQFEETREDATERPSPINFTNQIKEGGTVDVLSREPLSASVHRFDSGEGWSGFFQALAAQAHQRNQRSASRHDCTNANNPSTGN